MEELLCARHCAGAPYTSLSHLLTALAQAICPLWEEESGTRRLYNFPEVAPPASGRARIQTQICLTPEPVCLLTAIQHVPVEPALVDMFVSESRFVVHHKSNSDLLNEDGRVSSD